MRKTCSVTAAAMAMLLGLLAGSGCHMRGGASDGGPGSELYDAARVGNNERVDQLLASGTNVDQRGTHQWTPLAVAIFQGHLDTAEKLLNAGANPAAQDDKGITPLMWAASRGHTDLLAKMIARHPPLDTQDRRGFTAVYIAADQRRPDAYKVLADAGADVNIRDRKGRSAQDVLSIKGLSVSSSTKPGM